MKGLVLNDNGSLDSNQRRIVPFVIWRLDSSSFSHQEYAQEDEVVKHARRKS